MAHRNKYLKYRNLGIVGIELAMGFSGMVDEAGRNLR